MCEGTSFPTIYISIRNFTIRIRIFCACAYIIYLIRTLGNGNHFSSSSPSTAASIINFINLMQQHLEESMVSINLSKNRASKSTEQNCYALCSEVVYCEIWLLDILSDISPSSGLPREPVVLLLVYNLNKIHVKPSDWNCYIYIGT